MLNESSVRLGPQAHAFTSFETHVFEPGSQVPLASYAGPWPEQSQWTPRHSLFVAHGWPHSLVHWGMPIPKWASHFPGASSESVIGTACQGGAGASTVPP